MILMATLDDSVRSKILVMIDGATDKEKEIIWNLFDLFERESRYVRLLNRMTTANLSTYLLTDVPGNDLFAHKFDIKLLELDVIRQTMQNYINDAKQCGLYARFPIEIQKRFDQYSISKSVTSESEVKAIELK